MFPADRHRSGRCRPRPWLRHWHYPCDITLGEHAESMGGHDGEEELIYLAQRQRGVRHHADLALHARIDDERLAAELADLIDEGAYVGVLRLIVQPSWRVLLASMPGSATAGQGAASRLVAIRQAAGAKRLRHRSIVFHGLVVEGAASGWFTASSRCWRRASICCCICCVSSSCGSA